MFCNERCENLFTNPPAPKPTVIKKGCRFCGKMLKEDQKIYCSVDCKLSNNTTLNLVCQRCSGKFRGIAGNRYCSDGCRVEAREARKKDKCIQCGGDMPADYVGTCSKECQIAWNAVK